MENFTYDDYLADEKKPKESKTFTYDDYLKDEPAQAASVTDKNDADVKNWLKSFYKGKQNVEDIEITPQIRERYNRQLEQVKPTIAPSEREMEEAMTPLGQLRRGLQNVLQGGTQAGTRLTDLAVRAYSANPQLAPTPQMGVMLGANKDNVQKALGQIIAGSGEIEKEKGLGGTTGSVLHQIGAMGVDIPAKYSNPAGMALMAAEGFIDGGDVTAQDYANQIASGGGNQTIENNKKIIDALIAGGMSTANAIALMGLGKISTAAPKGISRPAIEGAGMAGLSAIMGEDPIAGGILGLGFGAKKINATQKPIFEPKTPPKRGVIDERPGASVIGQGSGNRPVEPPTRPQESLKKEVTSAPSEAKPNEYIANGDKKQHKVKIVDEQPQVNTGDPLLGEGLVTETKKINDISAREITGNNKTVIKSISNTSGQKGSGTDFMIGEIRSEHSKGNTVVSDSFATSPQAYEMYRKINEAHGVSSSNPEFDLRVVGKNEAGGDRIEVFKIGDKRADSFPQFKPESEAAKLAGKPASIPESVSRGGMDYPVKGDYIRFRKDGPEYYVEKTDKKRMYLLDTRGLRQDIPINSPVINITSEKLAELEPTKTAKPIQEQDVIAKPEAVKTEAVPPTPESPSAPVMKPTGVAKDIETRAVEKKLVDGIEGLTEYESVNIKEQVKLAQELRDNNPQLLEDVALRGVNAPGKLKNMMAWNVYREQVERSGDVNKIIELATQSVRNKQISESAQNMRLIQQADAQSPTAAIIDINKAVKDAQKKRIETGEPDFVTKKLLKTKEELDAVMRQHEKDIGRLRDIWNRRKLNRYADSLKKRGGKLEQKIKELDFTDNPQYKTWLDKQTKTIRDRVTRLSKTYKELKEIHDRRTNGVSEPEAAELINLSNKITAAREKMDAGTGDRMDYGRAWVDFHEYKNDLKTRALKQTFREAARHPVKAVSNAAGVSKAIKAAFDNSYIFRQGLKTMWNHPGIWFKNSAQSFANAYHQFGGKHVMRELMADIVSRPNYMNGRMVKAKLAFGNPEEPFPSEVPAAVPFFGKLYKATETAFVGNAYKTRADLFDKFIDIAQKSGVDIDNKFQLESIGRLVNSMSGRGSLGKLEKVADVVNNVFFSARYLKSNIDVLTTPFNFRESSFVRKQAALNMLRMISGTAAILAIAKALDPKSVEFDPRSADFGKIRKGSTRFDVGGGLAGVITLASRLIKNSTKSSTSGKVKKLNTGKFGSMTSKDVIYSFFENKLSPAASVLVDLLQLRDRFTRKSPTIGGEILNLAAPMPVQNAMELLKNPDSANWLVGVIADGLGIGTNTYGKAKR